MERRERKPWGKNPVHPDGAYRHDEKHKKWINSISKLGKVQFSVREIFGHFGLPLEQSEDFERAILGGFPSAVVSPIIGLSIESREINDFLDYVESRLEPKVIMDALTPEGKKMASEYSPEWGYYPPSQS